MGAKRTWPYGPAEGHQDIVDDDTYDQLRLDHGRRDLEPAHVVIGEIARLTRETRGNIMSGAGLLSSITIGIALEAAFAARALQPDMLRAVNIILMLGLVICWLRAAILLAVAGTPVVSALGESRWRTGAPLDPRAPWLTLPPVGANHEEWTWIRVHLLVGAARLARHRAHLADTWTYITVCYFIVWTAVIIIGF
jgi:hypothetical protein